MILLIPLTTERAKHSKLQMYDQLRPFWNRLLIYWRSTSPIMCFHPLVTWEGGFYMSYIQWDCGLLRRAEKSPTWPGCDERFGVTTKTVLLIASLAFTAGRAVLLGKKEVRGCLSSPVGTWESGGQIRCHFSFQVHKKFRWMWRKGRKEWR